MRSKWYLAGCVATLFGCVTTASTFETILAKYQDPSHGWQRADGQVLRSPVAKDARSLAAGRDLYNTYCLMCHGANGAGDGPLAESSSPPPADLRRLKQTDHHIYLQVSMGRGAMPIWQKKLTEENLWDIVNFVQTLGDQEIPD